MGQSCVSFIATWTIRCQQLEVHEHDLTGTARKRYLIQSAKHTMFSNFHMHNSSRSCTSSTMTTMRTFLVSPWLVHFALCIAVLVYGSIDSHGERKYIPIDTEKVSQECNRAFVDVFSPSIDDEGALICCNPDDANSSGICQPPVSPPSFTILSRGIATND